MAAAICTILASVMPTWHCLLLMRVLLGLSLSGIEQRGAADVADNVRGALDTIDKNEEFIKLT
jgi:hypothetical protein